MLQLLCIMPSAVVFCLHERKSTESDLHSWRGIFILHNSFVVKHNAQCSLQGSGGGFSDIWRLHYFGANGILKTSKSCCLVVWCLGIFIQQRFMAWMKNRPLQEDFSRPPHLSRLLVTFAFEGASNFDGFVWGVLWLVFTTLSSTQRIPS